MIPLKRLLELLPPPQLERLAATYELDSTHTIKLSGPTMLVCLLNGLLHHPELTQRLLEETYQKQTGQSVDHSSFGKALARMNPAYFADLFNSLYERVADKALPAQRAVLHLRWVDATTVTLSSKLLQFGLLGGSRGHKGAQRHVKSVFELGEDKLPRLLHLCTEKSETSDNVALGETLLAHSEPGDLWIFDKGLSSRDRLRKIGQKQAYFLTLHTQQSVREETLLYQALPEQMPSRAPQPGEATLVVVRAYTAFFAKPGELNRWLDLPLVLVEAMRFDVRTKRWMPLAVLTNLPYDPQTQEVAGYDFLELCELYKRRWDIEVLFKFLKQHLSYSHLLSRCPTGIQNMIYVSLIAAILLIWYREQTGIDRGWRSVKFWLAEDVRQWTEFLLHSAPLLLDG